MTERRVPVTVTGNVLPRIGVLDPGPARAAIREVFLRHVIGGKRLSRGTRFASLVRSATPDAVLAGVELLADLTGAGVLVVDVGGATTDVYSALLPDAESRVRRRAATWPAPCGGPGPSRAISASAVSAPGTLAAAAAEESAGAGHRRGGLRRGSWPRWPRPSRCRAAAHARGHSAGPGQPRTGGRDLRDVRLVVGSGGVLRHGGGDAVLDAGAG